ncbi:MAG: 3D domain-containing protein [Syntrophothermus sp.]
MKIKIAIFIIYISFFTSISTYLHSTTTCNKALVKTKTNFSLSSSRAKCTPKCTPEVINTPKRNHKIISRGISNTPEPTHKVVLKSVNTSHNVIKQRVTKQPIKHEIIHTSNNVNKITSTPKPINKPVQNTVQNSMIFRVTAYDLSVESCGKSRSNPEFGVTSSGYNLSGKSRLEAMTIAADINILPYGTKVFISFDGTYSRYNGIYTVRDTGGAIHGYRIDLFMGDGSYSEMDAFGVHTARVRIIK